MVKKLTCVGRIVDFFVKSEENAWENGNIWEQKRGKEEEWFLGLENNEKMMNSASLYSGVRFL